MSAWHHQENLYLCWQTVKKKGAGGGLDKRSIDDYARHLKSNLQQLSRRLAARKYVPVPGKRIDIPKSDGTSRPIAMVTVEDKIVQVAVKQQIEPHFENDFLDCSYAYRPGKGHRRAIHRLEHYLRQKRPWITTCDIDDFFDSINHQLLLHKLQAKIKDPYFMELIQMWLKIGAFAGDRYIENKQGVPQGGVISPLLSNIYLHAFDVEMVQRKAAYVRFADDFIVAEKQKERALQHYNHARQFLEKELQLRINPPRQPVFQINQGFTFLGIYFKGQQKFIDRKKVSKALDKVEIIFGKAHKRPLHETVNLVNEAARSWKHHYGECHQGGLRIIQERIFNKLSYWVRRQREDGRLPDQQYIRGNLQRLMLLVELPAKDKSGIFQQIQKGQRQVRWVDAPGKPAAAQTDAAAATKPPAPSKKEKISPAPRRPVPADPAALKRKMAAKRQTFVRQFAAEYDLVLSSYGLFLGRDLQRLVVSHPNRKSKKYTASKIKHIIVMNRSVTISAAAVHLCARHNIPIDYIDGSGKPFARLATPENPAWRYGMYQLNALNSEKGLKIAVAIVEAKIRNQLNLMKYYSKSRREDQTFLNLFERESALMEAYLEELEEIPHLGLLDDVRGKLFGIEGRAAGAYWKMIRSMLGNRVEFKKREHRGAKDLVNSLLNYGYGILYSRVWGALMTAGLNVQISFLHCPQAGKPTLVFDLIEQFRAPVVDRAVFSMLNRNEKFYLNSSGWLTTESKNKLVENVFERLNTPVKFRKQRRTLQEIIHVQAKDMGKFLKGERKKYRPYIAKW